MKKENIKAINLEDFKNIPHTIIYNDNNTAILRNIKYPQTPKEVKLNCLVICFCEEGETTFHINHRKYTLRKDFCAILPPGTIISRGEESFHSIKTVAVAQSFLEEIICFNKETLNIMHYLYNNPIQPTGQASSYKMYLYKELLLTLINEESHVYSKQTRRFHFTGRYGRIY